MLDRNITNLPSFQEITSSFRVSPVTIDNVDEMTHQSSRKIELPFNTPLSSSTATPISPSWLSNTFTSYSVSILPPRILRAIRDRYILRNEAQVTAFVNQHPALGEVLIDVYPSLRANFPNAYLYLELFPAYPGETSEHLVLNISSSLSVKEAIEKLNNIENTWWLANIARADGKLSFDLEFR